MSADYRERALRGAVEHGIPFTMRVGQVVATCTAVHLQVDGQYRGVVEAKQFPSAGMAREFVRRAVSESGWKTWPAGGVS